MCLYHTSKHQPDLPCKRRQSRHGSHGTIPNTEGSTGISQPPNTSFGRLQSLALLGGKFDL